jgi:hypothetical protein
MPKLYMEVNSTKLTAQPKLIGLYKILGLYQRCESCAVMNLSCLNYGVGVTIPLRRHGGASVDIFHTDLYPTLQREIYWVLMPL